MTLFGAIAGLVALLAVGQAQENVASPPVEHGRTAFEQMLNRVPSSCVSEVQDEAVKICSNDCMIAVPDLDLPESDSCDLRIWGCVWPEQQASFSGSCPAGWTGSYSFDQTYEVRDCGITLVQVGSPVMGSGDCTRTRTETEVRSTCGTGYSGTQTFSRTISEQLNPLTSATTVVSTSAWTMTTNSCISNTCTAPWGATIANGSSVLAYQQVLRVDPACAVGTTIPACYDCTSQTRSCNNAVLSGSYTAASCTPGPALASCTLPWGGSVAHGGSVTAYAAPTAGICSSQTRLCSNGTLSGTYQYASCTASPPCSWADSCTPIAVAPNLGSEGKLCFIGFNPGCTSWYFYGNVPGIPSGRSMWVRY